MTIVVVLDVLNEPLDDAKKSGTVLWWRYALQFLASAPPTITTITLCVMYYEDGLDGVPEECTIGMID